nr:immunoglobulin light chain junction region [Macaca mulatta]MOV34047.1 immunoglobulin light chain junction region [Macaca mulatta]MOV34071.1 immunoglobulin light chain junction region [Macaca mulatta]MOV34200.1 immunoglobulin light chain junction region [Macaca mulatta]MOV34239.1 immunoglobulin light chain junction region [Macaca mulatta]
CVQGIDYPLTF